MRTTLKQTLAGAWMLLAALALSTTGCSQLEDTPDAPNVANGNEPISISIAPKPSFEAGDAATRNADADADTRSADAEAHTRSTVAPDGTFAWAAGDRVYVILTFDDLAATKKEQLWVKANNTDNSTANNGWTVYTGWNANTANDTPLTANDMTWPLGAKTCKVQAFHTNCGHTVGTDGLTGFTYADGQGDCMIFTKNDFAVGDNLAIAFEHQTTRITFTGLKPNTEYRLKKDNFDVYVYNSFVKSTFKYGGDHARKPFTTDNNGTFTRCMSLTDATIASVELTIYAADNTTSISKGTLQAQGSTGNWKTNGYRYTMKVSDFTGEINPSDRPGLTPPAPILSGEKVYEVNGYYVTNPYWGNYTWSFVTIDDNNPCKKAGNGWRIPTMKDFETMAGWGTSHPWISTNVQTTEVAIGTDATAFHNAFPKNNYYLSSEEKDVTNAWALHVITSNNMAAYQTSPKDEGKQLRCVRPFDPNKQP